VVFGATFTGAGLAEDMSKGIIDRFRSLPMSRSAVLVGRTASDVIYNVLSIAIMSLTGLLVGWRIRGSLPRRGGSAYAAAAGVRLRVLVGHGLRRAAGPERRGHQQRVVHGDHAADVRVQRVRPARVLPGLLQPFVEWNPVSAVTQAAARLFGNAAPPDDPRPGPCRTPSPTR
jgi:ABC-2 type transport system permease protein